MYVLVVGAGKVGWNLARELIDKGNELTIVESNRGRYQTVEQELEHAVQYGDGSELWVLERAGIERADLVIAVTGDDEDNILICQVAREKYGVERVIARCNNPRNLQHFELLGVKPAISATDLILRLIEHEVPRVGLLHLLDLPQERLEIIEIEVTPGSPAAGTMVKDIGIPEGSLVISILRDGREADAAYERPLLSKAYLAGSATRKDALFLDSDWWEENDVELLTRTSAMKLDASARVAKLSNKQEVEFGTALLATGANVRRLRVDGSDLDGIHYLRAFGNADAIRDEAGAAEHVVLVGGSYIACEVAATLAGAGRSCAMLMQEGVTLERQWGQEIGGFVQRQLEERGVE